MTLDKFVFVGFSDTRARLCMAKLFKRKLLLRPIILVPSGTDNIILAIFWTKGTAL